MPFDSLILSWFDSNKRELPWRKDRDPYHVWLSEIILQQTRVKQGYEYYLEFLKNFPEIRDLSEADEQRVLKIWQGLGYYSRARNLHATARTIVAEYDGIFPDNFKDLLKLKGIGPYTAAAIASICFGQAVPAIDGNAYRVYARYFDIRMDIARHSSYKYFFELGEKIISKDRPGDFNQAIMDLGATVCLPAQAKCNECPLNQSCKAFAAGTVDILPLNMKKTKTRKRFFRFLEITDGKRFLLCRRTGSDIWENLYTFPMIEGEDDQMALSFKALPLPTKLSWKRISQTRHLLTHQELYLTFWKTETSPAMLEKLAARLNAEIADPESIEHYPFPKPMETYCNTFLSYS